MQMTSMKVCGEGDAPHRRGLRCGVATLVLIGTLGASNPTSCWTPGELDGFETDPSALIELSGYVWDDLDGHGQLGGPALAYYGVDVGHYQDEAWANSMPILTDSDGLFSTDLGVEEWVLNEYRVHSQSPFQEIGQESKFRSADFRFHEKTYGPLELCITISNSARQRIQQWIQTINLDTYNWWETIVLNVIWEAAVISTYRSVVERQLKDYNVSLFPVDIGDYYGELGVVECPEYDPTDEEERLMLRRLTKISVTDWKDNVFFSNTPMGESFFRYPPFWLVKSGEGWIYTGAFDAKGFFQGLGSSPNDSAGYRIQDIGRALGGATTHEFGHTVGLVHLKAMQGSGYHVDPDSPAAAVRDSRTELMRDGRYMSRGDLMERCLWPRRGERCTMQFENVHHEFMLKAY